MAVNRRLYNYILKSRKSSVLPYHVVPLGDAVAKEVVVTGIYEGQLLIPLFEQALSSVLDEFRSQVALDVGANIGNHSLFFSKYFKSVISVEPNPVVLNILKANAALSGKNILVAPVDFSDKEAKLVFHVNESGNLGASGFEFAGRTTGKSIECMVERGDDFLARNGVKDKIGFLKLDIEGAELFALRGLSETLERDHPYIAFECHSALGETGGKAIFAFLRARGYSRFYAVQSSVDTSTGSLWSWIQRLIQGEIVSFETLDQPDEKSYLMIIAVPESRGFLV